MIKTVTLNAAVDKTVEVQDFRLGAVNRISKLQLDAGGKGINVSKVIQALKGESIALGALAGRNGEFIQAELERRGIVHDFLFVQGETRVNLKVVDPVNSTFTDINEPGIVISESELEQIEAKIFQGFTSETSLVLSGSVPSYVTPSIYRRWLERAKALGGKTFLDADGELLREGIKAKPFLVKPNLHELEKLVGQRLPNLEDVVKAARNILHQGVEVLVVSLGAEGALFAYEDQVIQAEALSVDVKSTVGAGDSMVAALSLVPPGEDYLQRAARWAIATSAAQVTTPGTQPPELDTVLAYLNQVRYRRLT
ncbi:fructose-1-phosphate kinase [Desulfosporosinus acidiphilus SJ4]|uniref:Tagatose-6-phosphate kinase n=1 Tax=Desulfosporosinus acidiphilus (strain DSM 22704 / JCM 16185 / SJ4) TaxID=646529 RepID=I4D2H8_DESAJ|nr:1-phosphofructokinase [Desulfosporosinus acidiphilus]AFM40002.1 fructose-1-phosphate kinase [Desulfosporosinus acidiphilus SJ4]